MKSCKQEMWALRQRGAGLSVTKVQVAKPLTALGTLVCYHRILCLNRILERGTEKVSTRISRVQHSVKCAVTTECSLKTDIALLLCQLYQATQARAGTALGSYRTLQSSDGLSKIRAKLNEFTLTQRGQAAECHSAFITATLVSLASSWKIFQMIKPESHFCLLLKLALILMEVIIPKGFSETQVEPIAQARFKSSTHYLLPAGEYEDLHICSHDRSKCLFKSEGMLCAANLAWVFWIQWNCCISANGKIFHLIH